ncbi:MAG TPA: efflux RND transporter periplasmic adaptor subunit [Gemmatimonadales bacterium]|jgi:membrane fusion protein (multidrug efflux system)|nr:efflux RND transporter periplasmic adaptor subunit [Gemmatimonadales bacterium]
MKRCPVLIVPAGFAALVIVACGKAAPTARPPADVVVTSVVQQDVPIYQEWIGTLEGYVNAEIRPKVEGYLVKQLYQEGSYVKAGTALFAIDARQFAAQYDQSSGTLARAEAALEKANRDVALYTPLAAQQAVSQKELDDAISRRDEARGALLSAQAMQEQSKLNLGWTEVRSPIDGVVGVAQAQVGDLVNGGTVLTSVSTVNPIKVGFNISEQEYLRFAPLINQSLGKTRQGEGNLELVLENDSTYPFKGKVIAANREVDVKTGTLAVKGSFPNPNNYLRPGQFARVRAVIETRKGALLVPQRALNELQGSYQVGVVKNDTFTVKVVAPGPKVGQLQVINSGLEPGDQVVVEGFQRARPGEAVKIVTPKADTAKAETAKADTSKAKR